MKTIFIICVTAVVMAAFSVGRAATILQAAGGTTVAFEAEENVTLIAGSPTSWVITNDVTPSGDKALFASGANGTVFPSSFASYSILFATPGVYKLYFRWRANEIYTDADPNSANSFYAPLVLNANATPVNPNPDFSAATVNNTRVRPESNTYHVDPENTALLTVSQEQVDAGVPLQFTIGTREAGFMFDRIVLSQDVALTEAGFNATPNSDTDVFVQPPGANYVAFEAETAKAKIIAGTPTSWVVTNDVTPSGNTALFASGANGTVFPSSFVSYAIKFSTPGVYKLYFRWRANEIYTDADPNSANSFYAPLVFNANATPVNPNPDFSAATVNNTRVRPESNTYHVDPENTALLTVSQEQVDAGQPLLFTIGTREAGFMFDRIVLSQDTALTEAGFNALENTGTALPLLIEKAVSSASLTTVKVKFNKALDSLSLAPNNFKLNGGVTVDNADLDPVTLKDVTLTTSLQTEGFHYTLTVNDVNDLGSVVIAPNSTIDFFAWKLAPGFTRRELYFTIAGTDVGSLVNAAKFPNSPDRVDVVRGLSSSEPRAQNYGVRLTGFFIPAQSGNYEFYMYNDNDAQLSVSTDATAAGLQSIIDASTSPSMAFDPNVMGLSPSSMTAGQRYYIQVLLKQGTDYDTFVNVAARRAGDSTPVDQLPPLSGDRIGTLVDPATATMEITRQPASVTIAAGTRARVEVSAKSPGGPAFYQWQLAGANVPGATRAAFYTPILNVADSGIQVRCVIHAGGVVATSAVATVTVTPGSAPATQPYLGVNFIGGDAAGASGSLRPIDVVGVVPQANFNNVAGATATDVPLVDADGAATPVTIGYSARTYFTGTGENTAEDVLFQGYLHNANGAVVVTLNNVPDGSYDLYAYCVGFTYNATYEQAMSLAGGGTYPEYHVRAEHATDYSSAPSIFRRMSSTDPAARDQGNYVVFHEVSPDLAGALVLTVNNESDNPNDIDVTPTLSGLQLVRVPPGLSIQQQGSNVQISWGGAATGFTLESSRSLGGAPAANWGPVAGAPNPLTGASSITISIGAGADPVKFFRLRK
ncbi:MAG TPA: PA14 domain-containing protein [Verrucomicrobiae bacterium]|nr:PA14 domain-containing protein [Verrucomicrobiae bacterium]